MRVFMHILALIGSLVCEENKEKQHKHNTFVREKFRQRLGESALICDTVANAFVVLKNR